jgi:hypothetical protein
MLGGKRVKRGCQENLVPDRPMYPLKPFRDCIEELPDQDGRFFTGPVPDIPSLITDPEGVPGRHERLEKKYPVVLPD